MKSEASTQGSKHCNQIGRVLLAATIWVAAPTLSMAQWATNGNNINNTNTGNVGVGTATPGEKLDVIGNVRSSGYLWSNGPNGLAIGELLNVRRIKSNGSDFWFLTDGNASASLGVTTPLADVQSSLLTVSGASRLATGGGNIWIGANSGNHKINVANKGLIVFNTQAPVETVGSMIGGLGFFGIGVSHGQFDYRAGVGFEMLNVSADAPFLGHPATLFAPLFTGALTVTGNVTATGNIAAKYQDLAEWVPSKRAFPAGTVLVLDTEQTNHVQESSAPYDTHVAGVVSDQPGIILGEAGDDKLKVATTGRVKVKVDASVHPIQIGDLLVTSAKEGMAMRSEPLDLSGVALHRPGTILGKALEPLPTGEGEILVLLSLQ